MPAMDPTTMRESPWFAFFDVFRDVFDGGDVSFGYNDIWGDDDDDEPTLDPFGGTVARNLGQPDPRTPKVPGATAPRTGAFGEEFDLSAWTSAMENGRIPADAMAKVDGTSFLMEAHAAAAMSAMIEAARADGVNLSIGNSYRDYAGQVAARRRYEAGLGALAAEPGTSNHGWGLAADMQITPENHAWLVRNAAAFGFTNPFGNSYNAQENWHWEYGQDGSAPNYLGAADAPATWDELTGEAEDQFKVITEPVLPETTTIPTTLTDNADGFSTALGSLFPATTQRVVRKKPEEHTHA